MTYAKCDFVTNKFYSSQVIEVIPDCNCIVITNTGSDIVEIDGQVLNPGTPGTDLGDSITYGLNSFEVFNRKRISISFQGITGPEVTVIQKYYVPQ